MSCCKPLLALDLGIDNQTGKRRIKFLPNRVDLNIAYLEEKYGKDSVLLLPCGRCEGCKGDHKKSWALRCSLEASLYENNVFVTLTYSNDNVPLKLSKKPLQKFIKALRNRGYSFRYFGCGELGSQSARPHYHIILFNFIPPDLKAIGKSSSSGEIIFSSRLLNECWDYQGFISVGIFSPGAAAYVAGYVDKKIDKDSFILMSTRPGIAADWFNENYEKVYKYDSIIFNNGQVASVPRYFDKLAEKIGFDLSEIKQQRLEASSLSLLKFISEHDHTCKDSAIIARGDILKERSKRIKRGL